MTQRIPAPGICHGSVKGEATQGISFMLKVIPLSFTIRDVGGVEIMSHARAKAFVGLSSLWSTFPDRC
jgi:hypothetical protein